VKVRATARAKQEIARVARWWKQHRPEAPELFLDELEAAERHLSTAPETGQRYGYRQDRLIRRWLLERSALHVYFSIDNEAETVVIHSVWGARRGRGPKL
jgi:plasmid stabilization system protein ParE